MHFEFLVEDKSGATALEILIPKIIGTECTYKVHPYKGVGKIPRGMKDPKDASKRILLANLPKLLQGYGRAFNKYPQNYRAAVVVVCDLDDKNFEDFLGELVNILNSCNPKPDADFCLAIEEGEAWLLGDIRAITTAYPKADAARLAKYINDSICGTWEFLADTIYNGGHEALKAEGWVEVGRQKSVWSENICPHMEPDDNKSPSFCNFRDRLLDRLKS